MEAKNSTAGNLAVAGGVLLLITGITGVATWHKISGFISTTVLGDYLPGNLFPILILIASLGGIVVIIGGLLIRKDKIRIGKLLITIGVGMGLIGFVFSALYPIMSGDSLGFVGFGLGTVGIILTIAARTMAK